MPSDRTFVTELATALGMVGSDEPGRLLLAARPPDCLELEPDRWQELRCLYREGGYEADFRRGFSNGLAFLRSDEALAGRRPRLIEWTGGRRPPGDEVVPADLRVDHVYLVSCKYFSKILHNPSPARLVEGLLSTAPLGDARDWYVRTAPDEYQQLYELCAAAVPGGGLPLLAMTLTSDERRELAKALRKGWPEGAEAAYGGLCCAVSSTTAHEWSERLGKSRPDQLLWRLLRISSVPYFVLGSGPAGPLRLRIDTPWDWRRRYRLVEFVIEPQPARQPRVSWTARYEERDGPAGTVRGHVEIRWSHGRFAQPPEAKVYLDTPHESVPGYHRLGSDSGQSALWAT